ncbi:hypothetical protein D9M71_663960 [compost metagenome]
MHIVGYAGMLLSSLSSAAVRSAARQCWAEGLKGDEIAQVTKKDLLGECQAYERDGGGTVVMLNQR